MVFDEAANGGFEFGDGPDDAVFQSAAGEFGEAAPDGVQPGACCRHEVEGPALVAGGPDLDIGVLAGGMVIKDHVDGLALGAIARKVRCVASGGGGPWVRRTTSAVLSAVVFGMPGGRVFSCGNPSTPSAMNRSRQRQTQVFDTPAAAMIALVPGPSPDKRMIRPRQTCFCGEEVPE